MRISLLSTNTYHHWYLINYLKKYGFRFDLIIFETTSVEPKFPVGPFYNNEMYIYEEERWKDLIKKTEDYEEVENINDENSLNILNEFKPDISLVFGTRKIETSTLECFSKYLVNIHRGISQEYRGLDCELWPLYNKDFSNIGSTLHIIDKRLDTGNIIFQDKLNVYDIDKIYSLRSLTTEIATKQALNFFYLLSKDKVSHKKQTKVGKYYSFMPLELKKISEINLINNLKKNE